MIMTGNLPNLCLAEASTKLPRPCSVRSSCKCLNQDLQNFRMDKMYKA